MNNNFSEDEIKRILEQQQNNQNTESISLEELLIQLFLNPARVKTFRVNLNDVDGNPIVISENREGTSINEKGVSLEIQENISYMLSDGLSTTDIVQCQACKGIIHLQSLRRCPCGLTCCISRGCAKYSKSRDQFYCSSWHKFLDEIGFNLR